MDARDSDKRHKSAESDTPNRLLYGLLALWAEAPRADISVRMIAEAAEAAVSSIDYHFNGLERLYEEAQALALSDAARWSERRLAQLAPLSGQPLSSPARSAIIAAFIDDWTEGSRPAAMACREACAAARSGRGVEIHGRWMTLWGRFWDEACRMLCMAGHGETLALFFDGESAQHVLRWNRTLDRALLDETVAALLGFLDGKEMQPAPVRRAYRELAEAEYAELLDADIAPADPLDKAAVEILSTQGLAALTFRSVASRAGVTLGNASYHFGSKSRMIRRAFEHLYRSNASEPAMASQSSAGDLLRIVVSAIAEGNQPVLRAFDEIILHISRGEDHTLLRGAIRGYRDPAATWVLEALLDAPGRVPSSLAGAFSSICRGIDHLSLAIGSAEARRVGEHALSRFWRRE